MTNPSENDAAGSLPAIWKISHGSHEFNPAPDVLAYLDSNNLVTMNRRTGKGQGGNFISEMQIGDLFYLREGGKIKLFGRIESAADFVPEPVNKLFNDKEGDWVARKYSILCKAVSDAPYAGPQRTWTPNYNSTLGRVPDDSLAEFEKLILLPYFGKTLRDIAGKPEISPRVKTLRALFAEMLSPKYKAEDNWHDVYQLFCERTARAPKIDDNLLHDLFWKKWNGVSVIGQSIVTKDFYATLVASPEFRATLEAFRQNPDKAHFDAFVALTDSMAAKANHRKFHLRLNRIAVTFNTELSSVPNEDAFTTTLGWLEARDLLGFSPTGDWFSDNLRLTQSFTAALSDIPGYDIWERNMFLWWLYDTYAVADLPFSLETTPMPQTSSDSVPVVPTLLNTILYGPPGTGKTHNVINYALAIINGIPLPKTQTAAEYAKAKECFDALKAKGRVAFVTFHQSYGYEDFIEGIRPVLDEESEVSLGYELHDGVFKEFCKRALVHSSPMDETFGIRKDPTVWKVSLERTGDNATRTECMENGHIRVGWDDYGPIVTEQSFTNDNARKGVLDAFMNRMQIGDVVVSCYSASETDAIGVVTGDCEWDDSFAHFKRVRKVQWLVKGIKEDIRSINHGKNMVLATVYRLNIALSDILAIVEKHRAGKTVPQPKQQPYVFVIDEINRGNISKIFGELITLVEADKRLGMKEEAKAILPYSGTEFGVPRNVYILGTMNTADRSIALLDTALRRRFDFVEMMPDPKLLPEQGPERIDLQSMLQAMNERIEFLLDREHMIGHAYFLGDFAANPTVKGLARIFRNKIVPLLQEYFFEDYGKIRLVLGDASFKRKRRDLQFVTADSGLAKKLFPGVPDDFGGPVDAERVLYRINDEAFGNVASYQGIYQPPADGGGNAEGNAAEGE